jgi:hypothetical protein
MDPLQHATEAADLHEWEMSLRLAMLHAWPEVAATPGKQTLASRQCPSGSRRVSHPPVGWRRPGWLMSDGCARTCRELIETAGWAKSGCGRDRRCAGGMAHCGYEPTAVLATMGWLGQSLRALAAAAVIGAASPAAASLNATAAVGHAVRDACGPRRPQRYPGGPAGIWALGCGDDGR